MWVLAYLALALSFLILAQAVVLRVSGEPFQWTFGANSQQSKQLKLRLKLLLQSTLIGSIFLFPWLTGRTTPEYFGPMLNRQGWPFFLYGELLALALLIVIYGAGLAGKWLYWKPRYPPAKAVTKSTLSTLSSFTVVAVEEPLFRGIVLGTLLESGVQPLLAILLSAIVFSAAHFVRKVRTYWPSVGLAVLGIWLGVAFYKTGNLWFSMGLHSGGILSIGVHRCFINYRGPEWLVGTQTFPIAGMIAITIMLIGATATWFAF